MALTGHRADPVVPKTMSEPLHIWLHLDFFRWICTIWGFVWLPTATSPQARSVPGLMDAAEPGSSLPRRRSQNAEQAKAHRTNLSGRAVETRNFGIRYMGWAIIGSRIREGDPLSNYHLLIPAWTRFRTCREDWSLGSGRPCEICMFRTGGR